MCRLLSFRELPALLEALQQLPELPDVILCDARGARIAPFRHRLPSWGAARPPYPGVAKTRLIGSHAEPPEKGTGYRCWMAGK